MRNNKDNIIELNMITREQLEKNILCRSRMPDKIKERSKVRDAFVKNLTTSLQSDDFGIASASLIKELYDYFYFGSRTNRMKEQATNKQGAAYLLIEGVYHISRINQEIYALKNKLFLLEGGACQ